MVAHLSLFFHLGNTKRFEITCQQHLYIPVAHFSSTSNVISPKLSVELRPPDPTSSDNDKDDSPPKLGKDRMHRQFNAVKEAVAVDREVALELEEHLGMVGFGIRLGKGLGGSVRLGMFFVRHDLHSGIHANCCCRRTSHASSAFCAQHSTVIDRTDRGWGSFHLPSYEIHGSFTVLPCHHVACVQLSWSTTTPAHGISSPMPERVMVQVQVNDAASPSAAEV